MKSPMYKAVGSEISLTAAVLAEWLGSNKTSAAAVSLLAHVLRSKHAQVHSERVMPVV